MYHAYAFVSSRGEPMTSIRRVEAAGAGLWRQEDGQVQRLTPLLDGEALVESLAEAEAHCAERLERIAESFEGMAAACRQRAAAARVEVPT